MFKERWGQYWGNSRKQNIETTEYFVERRDQVFQKSIAGLNIIG